MNSSNVTQAPPAPPITGLAAWGGAPVELSGEAILAYASTMYSNVNNQIQSIMGQQNAANQEQTQIATIQQEIQAASANSGTTDPAQINQIEQQLEDLITGIQKNDPGCSQLGALEQLHDQIMASGSGPYATNPNSTPPNQVVWSTAGAGQNGMLQDCPGGYVYHGYYGSPASDTLAPAFPGCPSGTTVPSTVTGTKNPDDNLDTTDLGDYSQALTGINTALNSSSQIQMIRIQSLVQQSESVLTTASNILASNDDSANKLIANLHS